MRVCNVLFFMVSFKFLSAHELSGCPGDVVYDIILLFDNSNSFPNPRNIFADSYKKIFSEIEYGHPGSRFMLSTFTDVPIVPLGCATFGDHCYKEITLFTTSSEKLLKDFKGIGVSWGIDMKDSVDMAMNHIAHSHNLFRAESKTKDGKTILKVLLINTDSEYHDKKGTLQQALDMRRCNIGAKDCCGDEVKGGTGTDFSKFKVVPNRYAKDNFLECGFDKDGKLTGVFEDYPDENIMYKALAKQDIKIVTLLWGDGSTVEKDVGKWFTHYQPKYKAEGGFMSVGVLTDFAIESAQKLIVTQFMNVCSPK